MSEEEAAVYIQRWWRGDNQRSKRYLSLTDTRGYKEEEQEEEEKENEGKRESNNPLGKPPASPVVDSSGRTVKAPDIKSSL